jgi:hypothetical protein
MATRARDLAEHPTPAATAARWLVVVPILAAAIVYWPITTNYFREDDFVNFYYIANYGLGRFLITVWAEHALVTRNAIWWVLHALVGTRPEPYFALAYATHLAAVGLLYEAFRRLTRSAAAACVAAALWGAAPVHQEAIGWFSVYGQLLATAIVAAILIGFADAARLRGRRLALAVASVLVIATSFGVGLGIALALPVFAAIVVPRSEGRMRIALAFAGMAVVAFATYTGLIRLSWALYGPFPHLPITAALGVPDALVRLFGYLAGNGIVALVAGAFASGVHELDPAWWTIVAAWLAVVLVALVAAAPRERRVLLGALALSSACYVALAGGRAPYFARGMHFEHEARYQYAATVGIALATAVVLVVAGERLRLPTRARLGAAIASVAVLFGCVLAFAPPFDAHVRERREAASVVAAIRAEVAKAPPGADVYIPNRRFLGVGPMLATAGFPWFPGWAAVFAIFFPDDVVDGRRVHFVTDPAIVRAGRDGRRSAALLVPLP